MRLVTYDSGRGPRAGALRGEALVDVWDLLGGAPAAASEPSVRALLAAGSLDDARAAVDAAGEPAVALAEARLLPPVPDPDKLIGIGLNYASHAEEAGLEPPATPTFFSKFRNALVGPGAEVALPAASEKVDYEAEVAFVVGRRARAVGGGRARPHRRLHAPQRPLGARPPVRHAAVDAGQGVRRLGALRAGARDSRRGRRPRIDRDRAPLERRDHADRLDRRLDPLDPRAARPPVDAHDARARRRGVHGDAGGGGEPAPPAPVACLRRRGRGLLAAARAARDAARLGRPRSGAGCPPPEPTAVPRPPAERPCSSSTSAEAACRAGCGARPGRRRSPPRRSRWRSA